MAIFRLPVMFGELLDRVFPRLTKQHTQVPGLKLAILPSATLRATATETVHSHYVWPTIRSVVSSRELRKPLLTNSVKRYLTVLDPAGISITSSLRVQK